MDPKGEELAAMIGEVRQRVRLRNPNGTVLGDVVLPDLTPLLHARDIAEGKVASIGTVNPRPPGLGNSIAQSVKKLVARALDWHVREQVEFNRAVMSCVQSTIESLNECNRSISALASKIEQLHLASQQTALELRGEMQQVRGEIQNVRGESQQLYDEAQQLKDIRAHWIQWRAEWEQKLTLNEVHFLKGLSELQASFHHRVTLMDADYREYTKEIHADYMRSLDKSAQEIQQRLWADLDRIRTEYETIIHAELRLERQKSALVRAAEPVIREAAAEFDQIDWLKFAEKFRGSESAVKARSQMYADRFRGSAGVLDIGCGRGETLEVLREAGITAVGIDLNDDSLALCRSKGLNVEKADLFAYLSAQPYASIGGAVCCQVVEHLPPERLPEMIHLLHAKLRKGGLLAIETPNPECLAIFATHFYLDPTHQRPIPAPLLSFYLEEAGFGRIELERLSPAIETMPSLAELPEAFRKDFFGSLDYVVFAKKL